MEDPWISRIGPTAARARLTWVITRRVGVWLVAGAVLAAIVASILVAASSSENLDAPTTVAIVLATICAVTAFGALVSGIRSHMTGAEESWSFIRHRYVAITALDVSRAIRSLDDFDRAVSIWETAPSGGSNEVVAWTPNIRRPILRGPTSRVFLVASGPFFIVAILGSVSLALLGSGGNFLTPVLWHSLWAGVCILFSLGSVLWLMALFRGSSEFRAGYATAAVGGYWMSLAKSPHMLDLRISVDRVDARTGYVLRQAGDVRLNSDTYRNRLSAIRAAHGGEHPLRTAER